jgi:hypothetical protein
MTPAGPHPAFSTSGIVFDCDDPINANSWSSGGVFAPLIGYTMSHVSINK